MTNNYRCCTVLLVLNNSVSYLTNLYLFNHNVENLRIQTSPSNSPSPIPWPWNVCLELSYLLPPLWKNPGSAPGSSWIWITKSQFLLSASCKYVFHAGPGLFMFFAGCSVLYRSKKRRMDSTLNWSYINHGELHCQDCSLSNDNLVITFELALINSLATVLLLPLTVHSRPWFQFSMWTSSVARLALFLVAFTRATIVVLCRGENGKPFCLRELSPCTNTCIACIDRSDILRFLQSCHACVASKNIERNFILVPHTS